MNDTRLISFATIGLGAVLLMSMAADADACHHRRRCGGCYAYSACGGSGTACSTGCYNGLHDDDGGRPLLRRHRPMLFRRLPARRPQRSVRPPRPLRQQARGRRRRSATRLIRCLGRHPSP